MKPEKAILPQRQNLKSIDLIQTKDLKIPIILNPFLHNHLSSLKHS